MAPHIMSRCAPASDPPTTARGSCHTLARSSQSASDSPMGGRNPVRSSSATTMSSQRVEGVLARGLGDIAHRPTFVGGVLGCEGLVDDEVLPAGQGTDDPGFLRLGGGVEPGPLGGVGQGLHALGNGKGEHLRHPGRPSSTAPGSKQSRIFMVWGSVSATTVAPRSAAAVGAASWRSRPRD